MWKKKKGERKNGIKPIKRQVCGLIKENPLALRYSATEKKKKKTKELKKNLPPKILNHVKEEFV